MGLGIEGQLNELLVRVALPRMLHEHEENLDYQRLVQPAVVLHTRTQEVRSQVLECLVYLHRALHSLRSSCDAFNIGVGKRVRILCIAAFQLLCIAALQHTALSHVCVSRPVHCCFVFLLVRRSSAILKTFSSGRFIWGLSAGCSLR